MRIARYVTIDASLVWLISSLDVIQQQAKETNIYQFWAEYLKFYEVTSFVMGISRDTWGYVKC